VLACLAGEVDRRYQPAGPYEVAEVGQAVNELADRIGSLLAGARIAAADLGHRLRTPLTALRLDVETVTDPAEQARLSAGLDALEAAVNRLIRETRQAPEPVSGRADLAQAVRDRMAFWSLLAKSQQRPFDVRAPSRQVEVGLDRDELDAAIDALLSNVFAHTSEGTPFHVQLQRAATAARSWSLIVEDQGTGTNPQLARAGAGRGALAWGLTSSGAQPSAQAGQPRSGAARAAATGWRSGFPSSPRCRRKIFAVIDQSAEAREAGLELRDTTLVIFGSPAAYTAVAVGGGRWRREPSTRRSRTVLAGSALASRESRRMAVADSKPLRIGADATCTDGVCGGVSRGAQGVSAVDAAGTRPGPGLAFRWSLTATW
jgi:hypothetical protein